MVVTIMRKPFLCTRSLKATKQVLYALGQRKISRFWMFGLGIIKKLTNISACISGCMG